MRKENNKTGVLTVGLLVGVFIAYILLYGDWFRFNPAQAFITNGIQTKANEMANVESASDIANDSAGDFVITWTHEGSGGDPDPNGEGVYYQRYNSKGEAQEPNTSTPVEQLVNTTTVGNQNNSVIAMDKNGNFVIAWADDDNGSGNYRVFLQAFQNDGDTIGSEVPVNTSVSTQPPLPDISLEYDNNTTSAQIVVAWETSANARDIAMRRFEVDFSQTVTSPTAVSAETQVNDITHQSGIQREARVAMNTDGEFIVVWDGVADSPSGNHIWFQAYDSNGATLGTNTKINSNTVSSASRPGITTDKKNRDSNDADMRNYVIVFSGVSVDESDTGIFARQINCTDANPGNSSDTDITCALDPVELAVNSTTNSSQSFADVSADYLGNFTITWRDDGGADGNGQGIRAQSFKYNDGKPYSGLARLGTEFTVNTTTAGDQSEPAITLNDDGRYVVSFTNASDTDIYFQQFVSDLFKVGIETIGNTADAITQSNIDTAVAPNGYHAAVWTASGPTRGIYFTLWDENNNIIVQNQRLDGDGSINDDDYASISFFQDRTGNNAGRFVVTWQQSQPTCYTGGDAAFATDVYYREVNASGVPQGACETKLNLFAADDGNQIQPDVSAGFYDHDNNGTPEDIFTIAYINDPDVGATTIDTAYHEGTAFFRGSADGSCTNCSSVQVNLNPLDSDPLTNHIVYTWNDADDSSSGIFLRQARNGVLIRSEFQVNDANGLSQTRGDAAFLSDDQFIITYTEYDAGFTTANIFAKRYQFSESLNPTVIDNSFEISAFVEETGPQVYAKVTADSNAGDFLVVWTDLPNVLEDNQIYGQFYEFQDAAAGGLIAFGPSFRINSTQEGSQTLPAVSMNNFGDIIVGWEGNFEDNVGIGVSTDTDAAITQTLYNPLYAEPYPEFQPQARQEIIGGGRTLTVPTTINFPSATVNTAMATDVTVSVRDDTLVTPNCNLLATPCIEFEDLDGIASVITVSSSDFILDSDSQTYINATNVGVKNCDADISADPACIVTLNGNAADFELDPSTADDNNTPPGLDVFYNFTSDIEQKTLATKSGGALGKWRFFPKFRLTIPAITPPGNHSATITFSLT